MNDRSRATQCNTVEFELDLCEANIVGLWTKSNLKMRDCGSGGRDAKVLSTMINIE